MAPKTSVKVNSSFKNFIKLLILSCLTYQSIGEYVKEDSVTFVDLYEAGVDAYNNERWFDSINFFLRSIADYKYYVNNLANCRLVCKQRSHVVSDLALDPLLVFFESAMKIANCLRQCKKKVFVNHLYREVPIPPQMLENFERRKPYSYLQHSYHKLGNNKLGGAAAYTYYMGNSKDEVMLSNIYQYRDMKEVEDSDFVDYEMKKHQKLYAAGVDAYHKGDYLDVIELMEESLHLYYKEVEKCEALCEGSYDYHGQEDFYIAISSHFGDTLMCKQQCPTKLATIYGKHITDMIPDHYNYLQYSYFRAGDYKSSCEATESYLVFKPNDEAMLYNKQYFLDKGVPEEMFIPRQEAVEYHRRQVAETKLLSFLEMEYIPPKLVLGKQDEIDFQIVPLNEDDPILKLMSEMRSDERGNGDRIKEKPKKKPFNENMKVLAIDSDIGRYKVQNFMSQIDMEHMISAVQVAGIIRPGRYIEKSKDPQVYLTELIQNLEIDRAAEVGYMKKLSPEFVHKYYDTIHLIKSFVELQYNYTGDLYFRSINVICRDIHNMELEGQSLEKIQVDCIQMEDGNCYREDRPPYQPDYSVVLFLNDDFENGKLYFKGEQIENAAQPKAGDMYVFTAQSENHLAQLTKGSRCSLAITFTKDKQQRSLSFIKSQRHLQVTKPKLDGFTAYKAPRKEKADVINVYARNGITISLNETDLGPERFAADGIASEEDCKKLIQLAEMGGEGDGYEHTLTKNEALDSPHTAMESFQGITIAEAAKLAEKGKVDPDFVWLYLNLSEKVREVTELYLGLNQPLYFDYTHLVCRTAKEGDHSKRPKDDISHPIHSDNCIIDNDNTEICKRQVPAYIQRDYSAVMYLNSNFEGGDFFFAKRDLSIESRVKPRCGRSVSFNASVYHGVDSVVAGQRCAIAIWFTLDPYYKERAHFNARNILNRMKQPVLTPPPANPKHVEL